ncbi:molybdenum cofactor guanylyltransferase MobA [Rhizobium sp. RU35A]|uniref:molybdenum cofactor guanylyltransferase MobA n=1 Tax=Rhizobium sp. RU35A TaxID=1907414 RepID=UPI001FCE31C9|nr:molybdenum cofactor guanylyltransferase MobA [Rhizobium sp. RU35A]
MTGDDPLNPPGVILAGGRSRRMGQNKADVLLGPKTLLAHVVDRIRPQVSTLALNVAEDAFGDIKDDGRGTALPRVPDTLPGRRGPLAGILAAMRHTAASHPHVTHVLTVPVDSPFLPGDLMARFAEVATTSEAIAIASSDGNLHPVCGLWPVSLADTLQTFLEGPDEPRVKGFLEGQKTSVVDFELRVTALGPLDPFLNVNTPDDLETARRFLETHP